MSAILTKISALYNNYMALMLGLAILHLLGSTALQSLKYILATFIHAKTRVQLNLDLDLDFKKNIIILKI